MSDILAEEQDLIERVNRLEGRMDKLPELQQQVTTLLVGRKILVWVLALVVPALVGALVSVLLWAVGRIEASALRVGETAADLRAIKEASARQEIEISELRAQLWSLGRRSGLDHGPPTSTDLPPPDKFSLFDVGPSPLGVTGCSSPHRPKLQRPQPCCGRIWHSTLLEHTSPQTCGVMLGDFPEVQAARAATMTTMMLRIPYL